jgi:acyl-CoA dehydrogenase
MNFDDSPEDAEFRREVCAWLAARVPPRKSNALRRRIGKDDVNELSQARAWQRAKAEAGYAQVTYPPGLGGRSGTAIQEVIFRSEESAFEVPDNPFVIGLGMCMPTLLQHATKEIIARFVSPAVRGDEIWCQLFSEPSGGSDLASLRTRAEREGQRWRVNGQKIWTSRAHLADFGLLLTRTDLSVPKHAGLTMFWLNMRAPGVEVRGIRQMSGDFEFNEVFLSDVLIDDAQRIGDVGAGWKIAVSTLSEERLVVGIGEESGGVADLIELANAVTRAEGETVIDDALRIKIAEWFAQEQGLRHTVNRTLTALAKGEKPGPEASIIKLVSASQRQQIASQALDLLGRSGLVARPFEGCPDFQYLYLWSPAARIAGGTDEILRNIIAERVLGLPAEARVDKGVAFKDIPVGR